MPQRQLCILLALAPVIFATVSLLEGESASTPYVPISKPADSTELSHTSASTLQDCKHQCDLMIECKGVKYVAETRACRLLGAPDSTPAANGVKAIERVAAAERKEVAQKAATKVEQSEAKVKKMKKNTKLLNAEAKVPPHRSTETDIYIPAKRNIAKEEVTAIEIPAIQRVYTAEADADTLLKTVHDAKLNGWPDVQVTKEHLVARLMSAENARFHCALAKKLHKKYISRVEQEVELDAKKSPGDIPQKVASEVQKMNTIIKRRANRETERQMEAEGDSIKEHFLILFKEGRDKAEKFLKQVKAKACSTPVITVDQVPEIQNVDQWKNCVDMIESCGLSAKVDENCALTCKKNPPLTKKDKEKAEVEAETKKAMKATANAEVEAERAEAGDATAKAKVKAKVKANADMKAGAKAHVQAAPATW